MDGYGFCTPQPHRLQKNQIKVKLSSSRSKGGDSIKSQDQHSWGKFLSHYFLRLGVDLNSLLLTLYTVTTTTHYTVTTTTPYTVTTTKTNKTLIFLSHSEKGIFGRSSMSSKRQLFKSKHFFSKTKNLI